MVLQLKDKHVELFFSPVTEFEGDELDLMKKWELTLGDEPHAQTTVTQALVVLKEICAGGTVATALMQQKQVSPEILDSSYKGVQAKNGGFVGMLEVIESDFALSEPEIVQREAMQALLSGFMY